MYSMIVYQDDDFFFFQFCARLPEILSFKHHEIEEFAKNHCISEMKINTQIFFLILVRACFSKILSLLNLCDTISKLISYIALGACLYCM
jgi:hypothetical protein